MDYCNWNCFLLLISGTGKSSIVCALCLGLGEKPTTLGRAKDVSLPFSYKNVYVVLFKIMHLLNLCKAIQLVEKSIQNFCWGFFQMCIYLLYIILNIFSLKFPRFIALGVCKTQKEQGNNWDWIVSIILWILKKL